MNLTSFNHERKFSILLFIFFFSTVLPQMLYLTREDTVGIILKVFLTIVVLSYILFWVIKQQLEINIIEILLGIILLLIQIFSNWIFSYLDAGITLEGMVNISISFLYYVLFMSLLSLEKVGKKGILIFGDFYNFFLLYACIVNIILNYQNILDLNIMSSSYEYNFSSFFTNRNTFALFLLIGVMLTLYSMSVRSITFDKIIFLIIILNLLLTFSRTALLGSLVFISLFYILNIRKHIFRKIILLIFFLVIIFTISSITGFNSFFLNNIIRLEVGTTGRTAIWKEVLEVINSNNIFFGVGQSIAKYYTIHNTLLTILAYGGILLVIFYIFLFIGIIRIDVKIYKRDKQLGALFISSLITFFVISNTETIIPFLSNALNTIYTILIVLMPRYCINMLSEN